MPYSHIKILQIPSDKAVKNMAVNPIGLEELVVHFILVVQATDP